MEVIEHLDFPEDVIAQIHKILKPGGKLLIVFPNDLVFKIARILTLKIKEAFYDPGHVKQWKPQLMRLFLSEFGFKVCFSKSIPFFSWNTSLHCLVAARKIAQGC